MSRALVAWTSTLVLAVAGTQVAHALAYELTTAGATDRARLLSLTGHGYLGNARLAIALGAGILAAVLAAEGRAVRRRAGAETRLWRFGLVAIVVLVVQEHLERLAHDGAFPWTAALEPTFLTALALQIPFALAAFAVSWLLLSAVRLIALRRRAGVWARRASTAVRRWIGTVPRRLLALALGYSERGPPAVRDAMPPLRVPSRAAEARLASAPPPSKRPRPPWRPRLSRHGALVLAIVLLAAALRLLRLGYQSLGADEGYTFGLAQRPAGHMLDLLSFEANGALYTVLAWPLVQLHESVVLARLPAALTGALAVAATYWAGRELLDRRAALAGALLVALSPAAVFYSQIARAYVLAVLLTALSYALLARAVRTRLAWWWAGYAVALATLAYANALALVLAVSAQAVVVLPRGRAVTLAWVRVGVLTGALIVPLVALLHAEAERRDPLYYLSRPGLGALRFWLRDLAAGHADGRTAAAYAIVLVSSAVLGYALVRRRSWLRRSWWAAGGGLVAVAAWATVPPLAAFAMSFVYPVFAPAYLVPALPGVALLIGAALERLPRVAAGAALAVLVLLFAVCLQWQATHQATQDYRGVARWLEERREPADPLLVDHVGGLASLGYYARTVRSPNGWLVVKEWRDTPMPRRVFGLTDPGGYGDAPEGPPTPELVARLARVTGTLYVVLTDTTLQGNLLEDAGIGWARRHCRIVHRAFQDLDALAVSRCRG